MTKDHEQEVQTVSTVKPGLGYPNDRVELSPTPIGWQGLGDESIEHVSRETKGATR